MEKLFGDREGQQEKKDNNQEELKDQEKVEHREEKNEESFNTEALRRLESIQESIKNVKEKFIGTKVFPMGSIDNISYSNLGETLSIDISGDVSTNFDNASIIMVHPDARYEGGWVGKGNIGFNINGKGIDISKIPLPDETVKKIQEIYQEYTGQESRHYFQREYGNDATKFAQMGLYNQIAEKENK